MRRHGRHRRPVLHRRARGAAAVARHRRRDGGQRHLAAAAPRVRTARARGLRDRRPRPLLALRRQRSRQDHGADGRAEARRRPRRHPRSRVGWLRAIGATKVGITGFCMGGGYTYLAATSGDVDAAVPFYGGGIAQNLGTAQCPLLAFFGGNDEWIPRDQIAQVEAAPSRRRRRLRRRGTRLHARRLRQLPRDRRARRVDSACSPSSPNTYRSSDGTPHTRQDRHPGVGAVPRRHDVRPVGQPRSRRLRSRSSTTRSTTASTSSTPPTCTRRASRRRSSARR